jgi:hypothetical protein
MKLDVKSLLKDKNVLYVVLFLAVMNLFGYLMLRDLDAVFFFLALGLVTSYFSKNMIIVMIVAMIGTNLLMSTRRPMKEGFEEKEKTDNGKSKGSSSDAVVPASAKEDEEEATGKKPNIDYASTLEKAYDNLDKLLGSDALKQMSDRTQNLAAQQANLMETMKGMEPMMQRAGQMLEGLDVGQMGGMIEGLTKKLEGLKM